MPRVAKEDFTFTRDDCRPIYFAAGDQIPPEYADHWYVVLHSDDQPEEPAQQPDAKPAKAK